MMAMQTVLWGGPLDGCQFNTPDPPQVEVVIPQFPGWTTVEYASEATNIQMIRHHYVFDEVSHRYNYAGDWPR